MTYDRDEVPLIKPEHRKYWKGDARRNQSFSTIVEEQEEDDDLLPSHLRESVKQSTSFELNVSAPRTKGKDIIEWQKNILEKVEEEKEMRARIAQFNLKNYVTSPTVSTKEIKSNTSLVNENKQDAKNEPKYSNKYEDVFRDSSFGSEDKFKVFLNNITNDSLGKSMKNTPEASLKILEQNLYRSEEENRKTFSNLESSTEKSEGKRNNKKKKKNVTSRDQTVSVPEFINAEKNRKYSKIDEREPWRLVGTSSVLDRQFNNFSGVSPIRRRVTRWRKPRVILKNEFENKFHPRTSRNQPSHYKRVAATSTFNMDFDSLPNKEGNDNMKNPVLIYLHNQKAINISSPYKNQQFARVGIFRKEFEAPLVRGINVKEPKRSKITVQNVKFVKNTFAVRKEKEINDLLEFSEDIKNINNYLKYEAQHKVNYPPAKPREPLPNKFTIKRPEKVINTVQPIEDRKVIAEKRELVDRFFNDLNDQLIIQDQIKDDYYRL